jgi:hypothetical protein
MSSSEARGAPSAAVNGGDDAGALDFDGGTQDANAVDALVDGGTESIPPAPARVPQAAAVLLETSSPSNLKHKKKHPPESEAPETQLAEDEAAPEAEAAPTPSVQGDEFGQDEPGTKRLGASVRLLLQTRYSHVWRDDSGTAGPSLQDPDGFQLNRAFVRVAVRANEWLSAKLLVDFAQLAYNSPLQALKLAYGEIRPSKRVELTLGLFKRTYSLLELLPIADFEFADTGPTDALVKSTQFAGRDVGAMVRIDPLPRRRWLHVYLGAFGGGGFAADSFGTGASTPGAKTGPDGASTSALLTARLMSRPIKRVSLGADVAWRPGGEVPSPAGTFLTSRAIGSGFAVSADATLSMKLIELRVEWLRGDRTDLASRGDARTFMGAWGIAAIRLPVRTVVVMPAFRLEWLDSDREHPTLGGREIFSGALNVDVTDKLRMVGDLSHTIVQPGSVSLTSMNGALDSNATVVVFQVQLKL